ncbi:hypothetical protein [Streptomyces sp. NPDC018000]|uniref:hypothetical protein n=1 Tax=Streptomyces sp. NPDC018000 TaxID=3365028 RepID=UPI003791C755
MPVEYLSVEQEARCGRFATEPSPGELEQFFRLDTKALEPVRAKRRPRLPSRTIQVDTQRVAHRSGRRQGR